MNTRNQSFFLSRFLSEYLTLNKEWSENMKKCPICGGDILGDGFTEYIRCENSEYQEIESDSKPIYCAVDAKRDIKKAADTK